MVERILLAPDEQTLQDARSFAQSNGMALEDLLLDYLKALAKLQRNQELSPIVAQMIGIGQISTDEEVDEVKWQYLKEKYLS